MAGNLNPRLGTNDLFNVTASDGITGRFRVFNTGAICYIPMSMNQNILNGIPTPVSNDDAVNKLFVDNRNTALATQLPYVGTNGIISGATRNFWIQQGITTIQSAINAVQLGV